MNRTVAGMLLLAVMLTAGCLHGGGSAEEAPEQDTSPLTDRFTMQELPHDAHSLKAVNGTPAYIAANGSGEYLVHGPDVIASAPAIETFYYNDGEWGYVTRDAPRDASPAETDWFVHHGDYTSDPYDRVQTFIPVKGTWAYSAEQDGETVLVYKDNQVAMKYDLDTPQPTAIGDRLAYVARNGDETIIVYDGNEEDRGQDIRPTIWGLGGKLSYPRTRSTADADNLKTLIFGRKHITTPYTTVKHPVWMNGSVFYVGRNATGDFIEQYPEERTDGPFQQITWMGATENKVLYTVAVDGDMYLQAGDERLGDTYDTIKTYSITPVNGTIAFVAQNDGALASAEFIVYDGNRVAEQFSNIRGLTAVNGRLMFLADRDGTSYLVREE